MKKAISLLVTAFLTMHSRYLHAVDNVLCRLNNVSETDNGWNACCPAHGDTSPSLSITETADGMVLLHCHAGCDIEDIVESLRLDFSDLRPNLQRGNRRDVIRERFLPRQISLSQSYSRETLPDFRCLAGYFQAAFTIQKRNLLADNVGLHPGMFESFCLGWGRDSFGEFCAIPEFDSHMNPIGILRRYPDSSKYMIPGGARGLIYAGTWATHPTPVFICEGLTDTVVLNACGLAAIGRPSANGGASLLAELLAGCGRDIYLLGENDQRVDGSWPGKTGADRVAESLRAQLNMNVPLIMPPANYKDVRHLYHAAGQQGVHTWLLNQTNNITEMENG